MADSVDKLPLGIYKSMMAKVYRTLNNPILYEGKQYALPPLFKATETHSPCTNTDYNYEIIKKMNNTRRFNKEHLLKSRQSFMEDYLKHIQNTI